jgi:hypothetical protein
MTTQKIQKARSGDAAMTQRKAFRIPEVLTETKQEALLSQQNLTRPGLTIHFLS